VGGSGFLNRMDVERRFAGASTVSPQEFLYPVASRHAVSRPSGFPYEVITGQYLRSLTAICCATHRTAWPGPLDSPSRTW
jgi:hypothetical protein